MLPRMRQAYRLAACPLIRPLGHSTGAGANLHTSSARCAEDLASNGRVDKLESKIRLQQVAIEGGFYLVGGVGLLFGYALWQLTTYHCNNLKWDLEAKVNKEKWELERNINKLESGLGRNIINEKWELQDNINKLDLKLHQELREQRGELQGNMSAQRVQLNKEDRELRRLIVEQAKKLQVLEMDHNELKRQLSKDHTQA